MLNNNLDASAKPPLRDRLIPWYFVMGFAVVFAVNGVFVYVATSTNRGVVTEHPYEKGIRYNETLAAQQAQQALGWHSEVSYADGTFRATLHDAKGQPLSGAKVQAFVARPIEAELQTTLALEEMSAGLYESALNLPKKGQWDITVSFQWNNTPFQTHTRLIAK